MPASARIKARASRGVRPPTSGVPVAGANAGSITSMSKLRYAGAVADARAHTPRVVRRSTFALQLLPCDHLEAQLARRGEVVCRIERAAHARQQRALRREQSLLHRAPERGAVEVALAVVVVPGVGVRIEQHQRDRPVHGGLRAQLAEHDRVVAAEHDRHDARAKQRLEPLRDLLGRALALPGVSSRSPQSDDREARRTRPRRAAGGRAAGSAEAERIASGPNRAPGRKLVAVSNGTPTTATSTPSSSVTCGQRAKVRTPV